MERKYLILLILSVTTMHIVNGQTKAEYRVPKPTAIVLSPRGFRISIPGKKLG